MPVSNKKSQLSGPMITSLDKLQQKPNTQELATTIATIWLAGLMDMMEHGLGESVSVRYAANCLEAWLDRENTAIQAISSGVMGMNDPRNYPEPIHTMTIDGKLSKKGGT